MLYALPLSAQQSIQSRRTNPADDTQARQTLLEDAKKLNLPLGWVCAEGDPYNAIKSLVRVIVADGC